MKRQNILIIASKKRKVSDECETTEKNELIHTEKQIEREILEVDGQKTIKEVETSSTNNQSLTRSIILRHKETAKTTIEHLKLTEPNLIIAHSPMARRRYCDIDYEKQSFHRKYPKKFILPSHLENKPLEDLIAELKNKHEYTQLIQEYEDPENKSKEKQLIKDKCIKILEKRELERQIISTEALKTYLAAPFVDFTWFEIMNSTIVFQQIDLERILLNKLVWNAVFTKDINENETLSMVINDKSGKITLDSFDVDRKTASIRLIVESHNIDILLNLRNVDPFLLLLIPDKISQSRIRTYTTSFAQDVLSSRED